MTEIFNQIKLELDKDIEHHNTWSSVLEVMSSKISNKKFSEAQKEDIDRLTFTRNNILENANGKKCDSLIVISRQIYKPSNPQGWNDLLHHLQVEGYKQGFNLVIGSASDRWNCYRLICNRGRLFQKKKSKMDNGEYDVNENGYHPSARHKTIRDKFTKKGMKRKNTDNFIHTYTTKPTQKECICKFKVTIHVEKEKDCFFVKSSIGCDKHNSHPKKILHEIVPICRTANNDIKSLVKNANELSLPSNVAMRNVRHVSGLNYSRHFVAQNSHQQQIDLLLNNCTDADQLIHFIQASNNVKSLVLYDEYDRECLHTVAKKRNKLQIEMVDYNAQVSCTTESLPFAQCEGAVSESKSELDTIIDRLRVTSGQRVLLALAWTTESNSRHFHKFPEVISGDVVEGTNNQKRKLFIMLNYGPDGKSNSNTYIFLPSGRRWVFEWCANYALPRLHGESICAKIQQIIFDEDQNELLPFENAKHLYTKAKLRICWFHRFKLKIIPVINSIRSSRNDESDIAIEIVQAMANYISDYVETVMEYLIYVQLITLFINECEEKQYFTQAQAQILHEQIKMIEINNTKISQHNFMDVMTLKKRTTSSNEAKHKNLKIGLDRIQPNFCMKSTTQKIINKEEHISSLREQKIASNINKLAIWNNHQLQISSYAERLLKNEYDSKDKYIISRENKSKWIVTLKKEHMCTSYNKDIKCVTTPRVRRVRIILYSENHGYSCSCKLYITMGITCRHIFSIGVPIMKECVHVRYWNNYDFYYLRADVSTELNEKLKKLYLYSNPFLPLIDEPQEYPYYKCNINERNEMLSILAQNVPVFYNWDEEQINQAFKNTKMKEYTPSGFSQTITENYTMSQDSNNVTLNGFDCALKETNLYCHLMTYVSDISKYANHQDELLKEYLSKSMLQMVKNTILRCEGKIDNDELKQIISRDNNSTPKNCDGGGNNNRQKNDTPTSTIQMSTQYINLLPNVDNRKKDTRIKYYFEK